VGAALREEVEASRAGFVSKAVPYPIVAGGSDIYQLPVRMFSPPVSAGFFEIRGTDLAWVARAGQCEDLTARVRNWPEWDNIYPVAKEAVTIDGHVYGLPFHCGLNGLGYHGEVFESLGLDRGVSARANRSRCSDAVSG